MQGFCRAMQLCVKLLYNVLNCLIVVTEATQFSAANKHIVMYSELHIPYSYFLSIWVAK